MAMDPPYTEVRFTLPYCLPFADEFGFEWKDDLFWIRIENVQVFDRRSEEVTGFRIKTSGSGSSVKIANHHGLSHLSKITARFHELFEPSNKEAFDDAREHACDAVNRLIDVYRETTSDFRARRVMPQYDAMSLEVELVDERGGGRSGFAFGSLRRFAYPVKIREFTEARADMEVLLRAQMPVPFWREYLHEARRFFEEREFRLAVILGSAALELRWAELLRVGLEARATPPDERDKKMDKWITGTRTKGTLSSLDSALQEVFSRSIRTEDSALWGELEQARNLRKNVIHPWVKAPSGDEALRAMRAVELAMRWLLHEIGPLVAPRTVA